ncbi:hypothetical protein BDF19DRAFT_442382 [Syncephalis fuscata]|nr:hypothetical protein BDF19DRAFT_442382 [Syncephalis fuscata]
MVRLLHKRKKPACLLLVPMLSVSNYGQPIFMVAKALFCHQIKLFLLVRKFMRRYFTFPKKHPRILCLALTDF